MELGLSLGDPSKPLSESSSSKKHKNGVFDFRVALGLKTQENPPPENDGDGDGDGDDSASEGENSDNPLQLNLLPCSPLPRRRWSSDNGSSENGSSGNVCRPAARGLDVNRFPASEEVTSANSSGSHSQQFHLDFGMYGGVGGKRDFEAAGNDAVEAERPSDDDENGANNTRKKLRLSKDQAAFLEDSFKEHSTLNPKQKQALAKQLNLRPRQVEVWFQNRRARTKLKQTEVDCEYLKRCCETLTGENRRLQKELQDLRALKITNPFYMQLPATTLTMCPSCERVAPAPPPAKVDAAAAVPFPVINRHKFFPFSQNSIIHHNQPAAS